MLRNTSRFINRLQKIQKGYGKRLNKALGDAAETILNESNQLIPIDTGKLKSSGKVEKSKDRAMVIYDEDYAIYVHEDMEARHKRGQAKFLALAVVKKKNEIAKDIANELRGN